MQVNATGVMPVIFSSSLLALPAAASRYLRWDSVDAIARAVSPSGLLYLPVRRATQSPTCQGNIECCCRDPAALLACQCLEPGFGWCSVLKHWVKASRWGVAVCRLMSR